MKKNKILYLSVFFNLITQTIHAIPIVNFKSIGINPDQKSNLIDCEYKNILKEQPAPREGDSPIRQIELSSRTITNQDNHKTCQSIINNYTRLDEKQTQKEIALILKDFNCMPNKPINIITDSDINTNAQTYHKTKNANFLWRISLLGCLESDEGKHIPNPNECFYPRDGNHESSQIDYNDLIAFFKRCRDAINKKVDDEKLLEKWYAKNDPNNPRRRTNH